MTFCQAKIFSLTTPIGCKVFALIQIIYYSSGEGKAKVEGHAKGSFTLRVVITTSLSFTPNNNTKNMPVLFPGTLALIHSIPLNYGIKIMHDGKNCGDFADVCEKDSPRLTILLFP
jgi:hypothetical protein